MSDYSDSDYEDNGDYDEVVNYRQSRYVNSRLEESLEQYEEKNNIGNGEDQNIDVPGLKVNLYPHQKTSVYMMEKIEREKKYDVSPDTFIETSMSVFGDMPGYGKTLSWLALVSRDKMEWDMKKDFYYESILERGSSSTYTLKNKVKLNKLNCTLLVVSTSIIGQWDKELKRTNLKYAIVSTKKHINEVDATKLNIIVVSSTMYNLLVDKYQNYSWKRFGFDEAASTRIPNMKSVYAGFYWFITATFPALDRTSGRRSHFLKSIFQYMSQSTFNMMLVKNSNLYVASSFSMPPTRYINHKCITSAVSRMLLPILDNNVGEMIMAGNVNGAIRQLGGNVQEGNLVEVVLSKKADDLQKAQDHLRDAVKAFERRNNKEHKENVEKWEKKVNEINDAIKTIKERFNNALEEDCIICQDKLHKPVMLTCCQNMYCLACVNNLIQSRNNVKVPCPMCRTEIVNESIVKIKGYGDFENVKKKKKLVFDDDEVKEMKEEPENINWENHRVMSKPDTIEYILKTNPKGKYIIFSSYDDTFRIIHNKLREINIESVEIKGGKDTKEKKLESYINGDINVIFLNARFNGAGINLQNTTDIILYHAMPNHLMTQVIGRANRIGRQKPLTVHLLN